MAAAVCPAGAVWEYAPISEATRFADPGDSLWEFSLVFGNSTLYPADFYCPGNVRVILYVLNGTERTITVQRVNSQAKYVLVPNRVQSIDFGILKTGDHPFYVYIALNTDFTPDTREAFTTKTRLNCTIHATRWPGPVQTYRASLIVNKGHSYPARIFLPAGRHSELFIGSTKQSLPRKIEVDGKSLLVNPGSVSLTEFHNPAGNRFTLDLSARDSTELIIR